MNVQKKFLEETKDDLGETFSTSRDIPTLKEIEEFNNAIIENNTELLLNMIDSHPIRYFFNLKLFFI